MNDAPGQENLEDHDASECDPIEIKIDPTPAVEAIQEKRRAALDGRQRAEDIAAAAGQTISPEDVEKLKPFGFEDLVRIQQFGLQAADHKRLLITAFTQQAQIIRLQQDLQAHTQKASMWTDALVCMTELNGGELVVPLSVKKSLPTKTEFDSLYDDKIDSAVFRLRKPKGGIIIVGG